MENWEGGVDFYGYFGIYEDFPYPSPLPPTLNIELIRTETNIQGPCCGCKKAPGNLTCSRCKAIKYCSKECQRNGWKKHKDVCNIIKEHREETKSAIDVLSEKFGGTEALLTSPLVKEGCFNLSMGDQPPPNEQYIMARWSLVQSYAYCGKEALSCAAFRLAAENMLDVLCLAYSEFAEPIERFMRYTLCGWMVAGEMDQQALNYLCYLQHRHISPHRLPFLNDIENDYSNDIEDYSYINMFKEGKGTFKWFHDFMMIGLIKYKRLESLMVQRKNNMASWEMFIKGVESRSEEESAIHKIRGNVLVIEKLEGLVMEKTTDIRINRLNNQIKLILSTVNEENETIIPGIIDRSSITKPYGCAWEMSTAYTRVLQLFLDAGEVILGHTVTEDPGSFPVEGFLQASSNDDPTRDYGYENDLG